MVVRLCCSSTGQKSSLAIWSVGLSLKEERESLAVQRVAVVAVCCCCWLVLAVAFSLLFSSPLLLHRTFLLLLHSSSPIPHPSTALALHCSLALSPSLSPSPIIMASIDTGLVLAQPFFLCSLILISVISPPFVILLCHGYCCIQACNCSSS